MTSPSTLGLRLGDLPDEIPPGCVADLLALLDAAGCSLAYAAVAAGQRNADAVRRDVEADLLARRTRR